MLIMTKQKVLLLKYHLQRALENKLTKNFSVCSFYLICPKNGQPTQITYNGHVVGEIKDGLMTMCNFDEDVWRQEVYKYDLLHEIKDEFHTKQKQNAEDKRKKEGNTVRVTDDTKVKAPVPKRKVIEKRVKKS